MCAIYTRKSTEEGLEQEFNTLDAQRESAECYIKSQEAEGWICLPDHYDDGGYTGGNMDRPALKRLLADTYRVYTLEVQFDEVNRQGLRKSWEFAWLAMIMDRSDG